MSVPNMNFVSTQPVTTILTVHILIDGKEILPHVLRNEDVVKGVLMSWTHGEPRNVNALNQTIFLVPCSSGIFTEEIGSAIEKIGESLGKPVVITCDEVTTAQLPQVIECACHIKGMEPVVFNTRIDGMQSDSNQSVQSGYHSSTILNKIPSMPCFSGTE